ncbi:MAG: insulinase family protein [Dehalococcoidia bacterium]|nr:insulinase family protein [Dehalococcoidia bacterium]
MYEKTVLDNGLRVVSSTMPHTRSVCITIFVGAGSRYEPDDEAGISHFLEHLCFKGTARRPSSKDISETIDGIGGLLNGGTDKELMVYWVKVARHHFPLALDLLVDMLRNSKLDPVEMENERRVIIEELNMCVDSPQTRVDQLIDDLLWPGQPLGRDVAGTKETVSTITRDMMVDYISKHFVPGNAVVGIAGNISHEEVVSAVDAFLGDWADGPAAQWYPAHNEQHEPRLKVERRKTEQVNFCLAVRGLSQTHPDRYILNLINLVLGEGMSSRLFLEIRERLGLAYDVHSMVTFFHDSGSLNVCAGVAPKMVEDTVAAVVGELAKMKDTLVSNAEFTKAKEQGKGRLLLRMEDTRNVVGWVGGQELLTNHIRTVDDVISTVDAITPEDLQRVARDVFRTERLSLALVGPYSRESRLKRILKL